MESAFWFVIGLWIGGMLGFIIGAWLTASRDRSGE